MFADEAFGEVGVAAFEGGDDGRVFGHAAAGAVVLAHGDGSDGAHVDEQGSGDFRHEGDAAHAEDGAVEGHVGLAVFVEVCGRVGLVGVEEGAEGGDVGVGGVVGGASGGEAFEGGPDGDHFDEFGF